MRECQVFPPLTLTVTLTLILKYAHPSPLRPGKMCRPVMFSSGNVTSSLCVDISPHLSPCTGWRYRFHLRCLYTYARVQRVGGGNTQVRPARDFFHTHIGEWCAARVVEKQAANILVCDPLNFCCIPLNFRSRVLVPDLLSKSVLDLNFVPSTSWKALIRIPLPSIQNFKVKFMDAKTGSGVGPHIVSLRPLQCRLVHRPVVVVVVVVVPPNPSPRAPLETMPRSALLKSLKS